MKNIFLSILILLCLLPYSTICQAKSATSASEHNHQLLPNDSKWKHFIYSKMDSFKGKWIDEIAEYPSYFTQNGIPFSREKFNQFKFTPLITFVIDYKTFNNFNGTLSAGEIKIDSSKVRFYGYRNGSPIISVETSIKNGDMKPSSYCVISDDLSNAISKLSEKEKRSLVKILVNCFEGSSYQKDFTVYTNKQGQLMDINIFGRITPFEKKLQTLRETGHLDS